MSTIENLFQQAQLAEAAYANFVNSAGTLQTDVDSVKTALTTGDGKFSTAQATAFITDWSVVSQQPNTTSGFSATLFKNNHTGQYSLATQEARGQVLHYRISPC